MRRSILLLAVLSAAACTSTTKPADTPRAAVQPAPPPAPPAAATAAPDLTDHLGDSVVTAVEVPKDAPNEGIDFENQWIYGRFGRFRREKWAIANHDGREYKVVTVELADHTRRTVYFDVTNSWKAWTPSTPVPQP